MNQPLTIGKPLKLTFAGVLLLAAVAGIVSNTLAVGQGPGRPEPADFNVFHLAGGLVWSGRLGEAYRVATLMRLERTLTGSEAVIPWSYPPLFGLLLAPLAALPIWLAQAVFVAATLALFLGVTRRLAGPESWPVWLALAPCIGLNLQSGQNGLLTGGLAGAAALALLGRRPLAAGSAIAALAIKPHLAVMFPVVLVLWRRWLTLLVAGLGAAGLTALSIAVLGRDVFAAFLHSFAEVGRFMAAGAYPLPRMLSVYAALVSSGVPPAAALAGHGAVAVAVLGGTARIAAATADPRVKLGLAIAVTVFISPYVYDYDGTIFGVGLAILGPVLAARLPVRRYGLLLVGTAVSLCAGLMSTRFGLDRSLGGPLLLIVYAAVLTELGGGTRFVRSRRRSASDPAVREGTGP